MRAKFIKLRLVLDVEIDPQEETITYLKHRINQVVRDAVNNGTLTGDGTATVEKYSYEIQEIK